MNSVSEELNPLKETFRGTLDILRSFPFPGTGLARDATMTRRHTTKSDTCNRDGWLRFLWSMEEWKFRVGDQICCRHDETVGCQGSLDGRVRFPIVVPRAIFSPALRFHDSFPARLSREHNTSRGEIDFIVIVDLV